MKKMGKKKVLKVVTKELKKEAIRELKDLGYKSACRGACGRRMKEVVKKVKTERKENTKKINELKKFKKTVVIKQLKTYGIIVNTQITKSYFDEKVTFLNAKFAKGEITKSQWTQYTTMLKKWVTISHKTFETKIKKLKEKEKTGEITQKEVEVEVKKLKKVVKPEVKITKEQYKGVKEVLKTKVKVGKITKKQYKIKIAKVKTRVLITKAKFKTDVAELKIKMTSGNITPIEYKKEIK